MGFTLNSVWGQRWRMLHHHGRDYAKSHCLDVFISLHGWCKGFAIENGSIDAFDCSRYYQPMPNESIDVNYQLVEVSFDQTLPRHNIKKAPCNGAGNGEYLLWQVISHQNCNNTNSQMELFCAVMIPRFYISDFKTKT